MKFGICKNPKHLAWATWAILANNPINKNMYLVFQLIEGAFTLYYCLILIARIHFQNIQNQFENEDKKYLDDNNISNSKTYIDSTFQKGGLAYLNIKSIDDTFGNLMTSENRNTWFYMNCIILGITLILILSILFLAIFIKSHKHLQKQSYLKKCLCFVLVSFQTFMPMPSFDLIIRCIMTISWDYDSTGIVVAKYLTVTLTIILFFILILYIARLFNVCVPTPAIPWCYPVSKVVFLNQAQKAVIVGCVVIDQEGKYVIVEIIGLFIIQGFLGVYRLFFSPNYVKEVDMMVKTKDFLISLALLIGMICAAIGDTLNFDLVYLICFSPLVTLGWIQFENFRIQQILLKIKRKSLKMEIEYEFALYQLMMLIENTTQENFTSQKIAGQLMDIMITHIEECDDPLCICDEMENFYELMRYKYINNSEVFQLDRDERRKFKKIIDDQGLIGTVSNITDLVLKSSSSESTLLKLNNEMDRLNLKEDAKTLDRHKDNLQNDENVQSHNQEISENKFDDKSKLNHKHQKHKKSKQTFKINIDETKFRFLSELIYLFYFEMKQKFPNSFKIQLLSNYFALQYKKKEMLCIFQMRSFIKTKLSKLDQMTFIINEMYLLAEIEKMQKAQMVLNMDQADNNINGEYFIKINQLYKDFNISVEALSSSVVNFWKEFEREQINVEESFATGITISKNIQTTFRLFQELDDIKLFKDYQMYFQFAVVQLHILNDNVAYELYIGKMKSILETNKMFEKNFQNEKNSDYQNFVIVNANGNQFGQIIQINNSLRMLLQWQEEDFSKLRIEEFMPKLIKEKHDAFLDRYNKTGQSYIINNKTCMFLKKFNGYVIPVELYIKFHYSIDYQYVYLAIIRPFYEMAPYQNGVTYNLNQLIFMLVDNDSGEIFEYSESCKNILRFNKKNDSDNIVKRVGEFIEDFDFKQVAKSRQQRYVSGEIFEQIYTLDLSYFSDLTDIDFERNGNLIAFNGGLLESSKVRARVRIFEERYSGGVLDMNIFCFQIINEQEEGSSDYRSEAISKANLGLQNQLNLAIRNNVIDTIEEKDSEDGSGQGGDSSSVTSMSSSMKSSTTSMADYRNFHSFSNQATPRSLKMIIQLVFILYLIIIIVSSVNLGIIVSRQKQSELDVHTVKLANDRMNWISMNLLIQRVMLSIANGYEPEKSILVDDRFEMFKNLQKDRIQLLRETQSQLQQSQFVRSEELSKLLDGESITLYYLNDKNLVYKKSENLNIAFNLYIARLADMNSMTKEQMKGNLNFQTLTPNKSIYYQPTINEQNLYFTVENGNLGLRRYSIELLTLYARESEIHAEQNINQTKITAIISIITVVIVGIIIAPIFTKAEIRKYKALLYFLKIPKDILPQMIQNCEYCLNMNDEERYVQIQKDYESFLGIKIQNQQIEQLRQARDQDLNIQVQNSNSKSNTEYLTGSMVYSDSRGGNYPRSLSSHQTVETVRTNRTSGTQNSRVFIPNSIKNPEPLQTVEEEEAKQKQSESNHEDSEERDEDRAFEQRQSENSHQYANKNRINNLQVKKAKKKKEKNHNDNEDFDENGKALSESAKTEKKEAQKIQDLKDLAKANQIKEDKDTNDIKKKLIKQRAYKRRSTMAFSIIAIILSLSTYFIIAYFLAMKSFQTASDVIKTLELIFYKGSCFDSTMNFMRENEMRQQMVRLEEFQNAPAADYYLDFCLKKEAEYTQMKVNLPEYLRDAQYLIESLDSSQMCDHIYIGQYAYLSELCLDAVNGILKKGLSNTFYFMYTQILKNNLLINQNVNQKDIEYRKKLLNDTTIIQIIDMKAKLLDPALTLLKETSMRSVINYIKLQLDNFITAFIAFIIILTLFTVILVFVGFKKLRVSMWDTNIILKIIPFESISARDRVKIKDFFNS